MKIGTTYNMEVGIYAWIKLAYVPQSKISFTQTLKSRFYQVFFFLEQFSDIMKSRFNQVLMCANNFS